MNEQDRENIFTNIDILGSIEFDLAEAIKNLIWNVKTIRRDVDLIKKQLNSSKK